MPAAINIPVGTRFGKLVVRAYHGTIEGRQGCLWECRCDCGNVILVATAFLRNGNTASCGCVHYLHGMSESPEFGVWFGIITRCTDPNRKDAHNYIGRGITICDEWRHDFTAFYNHVGARPSPKHEIDRYPDKNGNYEPGNVRWATKKEQNRNRRDNVMITFQDRTMCLADWADYLGFKRSTLISRRHYGWTVERMLTTPIREW